MFWTSLKLYKTYIKRKENYQSYIKADDLKVMMTDCMEKEKKEVKVRFVDKK